jgi:hypothetical protein
MKMEGYAEMKIMKHGWRLGFRKYLVESKPERREGCRTTFFYRDPFFEPVRSG